MKKLDPNFTLNKWSIVLIGLIYLLLSANSAWLGGDFDVCLDAAARITKGQNIYQFGNYNGLQYYYSPFFATILSPISEGGRAIGFIWLLLSGAFFWRTTQLIISYFDFSQFTKRQKLLLLILVLFFIIAFILYNISMIQITMFLLWAIFESIHQIKNDRPIRGSLILSIAINIKLLPLVIIPYLIYRMKLRAVLWVMLFSGILLVLPALFIGIEYNQYLLHEWWDIINPISSTNMADTQMNNFSDVHNEVATSKEYTLLLITTGIRLFLVLFTLFFLSKPFKTNGNRLNEIRALAYICLIVPLIFPHQQKYAFLMIYPMLIYLGYYCIVKWNQGNSPQLFIFILALLIVSMAFSPIIGASLIGWELYEWIHAHNILGLASLLLVIFAAIASPEKLKTPNRV